MKRKILPSLGVVLAVLLTCAALLPLERAQKHRPDWMGRLSDDTAIAAMTIPGTHNSGALYSFADVSGKYQSVSIQQQMEMGVRFLDIRLQMDHNELIIVHSFGKQRLSFEDAMDGIAAFIRETPSEFLMISIKEDNDPAASDMPFSVCLEEMLCRYSDVIAPDSVPPATLGEARGKIYILSRYAEASLGIRASHGWQDSASFALGSLYIQDVYRIPGVSHKQDAIRAAVQEAAAGHYSLVLNHTSCYLNHGYPPVYAAAPAHEILPWLLELCTSDAPLPGVFICDFMTSELTEALLERNFA